MDFGSLPALAASGNFQMVVEIPGGTNKKIEYDYLTNTFPVEIVKGEQRVVQFLPYPGNYGFIPSTLMERSRGGDGDALDILLISEQLETGTLIEVLPIGALLLSDNGETDIKIIAVPFEENLRILDAITFEQLANDYPMVKELIALWFMNYKGGGRIKFRGWEDERVAGKTIHTWVKTE